MDQNNFIKKYNSKNIIDLEKKLIDNSDNFIELIIKNSHDDLDLSELGIVNLNLQVHNDLLKKIIKINISKNLLKNVLFIPNHIIHLNVSFNKLINIHFIKELTKLKYLNVSYNNDIIIENNIFENSLDLQSIEMAGNNLKSIPDILFLKLEELEYLNLAGNNLISIKNVTFPKKMEFLNISYNNIKKEEYDEFIKLKHVIF